MFLKISPSILALLVTALIAVGSAVFLWRRRAIPGARPIYFLMGLAALWSLGYAFELWSASLQAKLFWAKFEYLAIAVIPGIVLMAACEYTGYSRWLTNRNLVLLFLVPPITLASVWTNEYHFLFWHKVILYVAQQSAPLRFEYGPMFWMHFGYAYLLLALAILMLVNSYFRSKGIYKKQAGTFLLGALAPWIGNLIYITGIFPVTDLDLTPFAFTITGLFFTWGQFRFRFLDLAPIAREAIVENMSDAVIVLDAGNRVVDINPAAQELIGSQALKAIGQPAAQVLSRRPYLFSLYANTLQAHAEINLSRTSIPQMFDLKITPILDRQGSLAARLIVLRDITDRWLAEAAVQQSCVNLEQRVVERTAELQAANVQLLSEISERRIIMEALAHRLKLEELVSRISTSFINLEPQETDREITRALQLIGEATQMDRCSVIRFSDEHRRPYSTHAWCAPGIPPLPPPPDSLTLDLYPNCVDAFNRFECIQIPNTAELPEAVLDENRLLAALDIQALILVPLIQSGASIGMLWFDSVRSPFNKAWSDEDIILLKMVGEIFVSALERKQTGELLEASLHEKELLLKEIHHRVKNNLQTISSLLNLQANTITDPGALDVLRESQTRVRTIGMIHEKLYRSENFADIDFSSYIRSLTDYLGDIYRSSDNPVQLVLDVDPIAMDFDLALPCGLIINELVSNALKYAYPGQDGGEIRIELKRMEDLRLKLSIHDHGAGFPNGLDFRSVSSLGLQLVCSLVDQLDGEIEFCPGAGVNFEIAFRAP